MAQEEARDSTRSNPVDAEAGAPAPVSGRPPASGERPPELSDPVAQEVLVVVRTLLELIGIRARVEVEKAGSEYYANIRPQLSKGLLIGRRGGTLQAIQYITRLIVKRKFPDVPPVMIDVGGYRKYRESFLCRKAEAVAHIVMETKREMALDPLTGKERAMVEEHLRQFPGVRVYAISAGNKQNLIIAPKQ